MELSFDEAVELVGEVVDGVGILILLVGAVAALAPYVVRLVTRRAHERDYHEVRRKLGRAILLGLEFLVAADIIRTVVISPTLGSVAALGAIVLIRIFLSFALEVEIEGRWPWQAHAPPTPVRLDACVWRRSAELLGRHPAFRRNLMSPPVHAIASRIPAEYGSLLASARSASRRSCVRDARSRLTAVSSVNAMLLSLAA